MDAWSLWNRPAIALTVFSSYRTRGPDPGGVPPRPTRPLAPLPGRGGGPAVRGAQARGLGSEPVGPAVGLQPRNACSRESRQVFAHAGGGDAGSLVSAPGAHDPLVGELQVIVELEHHDPVAAPGRDGRGGGGPGLAKLRWGVPHC